MRRCCNMQSKQACSILYWTHHLLRTNLTGFTRRLGFTGSAKMNCLCRILILTGTAFYICWIYKFTWLLYYKRKMNGKMKYSATARLYAMMFNIMLGKYYKKYLPEKYREFPAIKRRTTEEFKSMVERTPGIGGVGLTSDLVGACYFFSMAKADPDMTPELMNDIVDKSIQSSFMQKAHEGKRKKGTLFSDKVQDRKVQEAAESQTANYEMGWKFTYEKGVNEFHCTYTKCGICTLAKKEHMERFLPCMCRMDYGTYDMVGAELIRTKTLAAGDECCNFYVRRKASS